MRRVLAAALLALAGACAPEKSREFELGLLGPVGPGVAAAARAAGLTIRDAIPDGADAVSAGEERLADYAALRLSVARAAARGRAGAIFLLPKAPEGRELTDFPEEWQALDRAAREAAVLRPILEAGIETDPPFAPAEGLEARAWRHQGRIYAVLVNDTASPIALDQEDLRAWRALFEVRADARDLLVACPAGRCLAAGRGLWLEGRL